MTLRLPIHNTPDGYQEPVQDHVQDRRGGRVEQAPTYVTGHAQQDARRAGTCIDHVADRDYDERGIAGHKHWAENAEQHWAKDDQARTDRDTRRGGEPYEPRVSAGAARADRFQPVRPWSGQGSC